MGRRVVVGGRMVGVGGGEHRVWVEGHGRQRVLLQVRGNNFLLWELELELELELEHGMLTVCRMEQGGSRWELVVCMLEQVGVLGRWSHG